MKRAVLYLRYSSSKQNEQSIEGQQTKCVEFCQKEKIQIVDTYIDRAASASKNLRRDAFEQMIEDSKQRTFDYVVVYKLDRFSRDRIESAIYRQQLKENGVKVLSATEGINDSIESILLESVLEGLNEYYSKELSQKVKRGMDETWKKDKRTGGTVSLGLKSVDGKLVEDESTSHIVKEVFELADSGFTFEEIAAICNERGYRTKRNRPFTKSAVWHMTQNDSYIGVCQYKGEKKKLSEGIISEDLFNRVHGKKQQKAKVFHLTGKVFCSEAEGLFTGTSGTSRNGDRYFYYTCTNRSCESCPFHSFKKQELEDEVFFGICEILNEDHLDEIVDAIYDSTHKNYSDQKASLKSRLYQVKKEQDNIIDQIAQGAPWVVFKEKIESQQKQIEDLENQITKIEILEADEHSKEYIKSWLVKFIRTDTPAFRKKIFTSLIQQVRISSLEDQVCLEIFLLADGKKPNQKTYYQICGSDSVRSRAPFRTKKNLLIIYRVFSKY